MSNTNKIGKFIIAALILIVCACKGGDSAKIDPASNYINPGSAKDSIPDDVLDFLDSIPSPTDTAETTVDGESESSFSRRDTGFRYHQFRVASSLSSIDQKKRFLFRITNQARFLCSPFETVKQAEGESAPAQDHLAYVFGRWDETVRSFPTSGACRDRKLFGLDCSGLLYNCLRTCQNDFNIEALRDPSSNTFWTGYLRNPANWNRALSTGNFTGLKVIQLSNQTSIDQMEDGDIVFWPRHVGIYRKGVIYNSYGTDIYPKCIKNINKGAKKIPFSTMIRPVKPVGGGWGQNYTILRVVVSNECGLVTDVEGNAYETVQIGSQCWFKRNLRTTKFNNGETIPTHIGYNGYTTVTRTPAFDYPFSQPANSLIFGNVYNQFAIQDPRGLCPSGWHVASKDDWSHLINFLGEKSAGDKMMDRDYWCSPFSSNFSNTLSNSTGLKLLPGNQKNTWGWLPRIACGSSSGMYSNDPYQENSNYDGWIWTSSDYGDFDSQGDKHYFGLYYQPYQNYGTNAHIGITYFSSPSLMPCRCVKD